MSAGDTLREHGQGMVGDLLFAVVWVGVVTGIHRLLQGPTWAYYLLLLAGVPAYFVFYASLSAAMAERKA